MPQPTSLVSATLVATLLTVLICAQTDTAKSDPGKTALARAQELVASDPKAAAAAAKDVIETDPDNFEAHDLFRKASSGGRRGTPEQAAEAAKRIEAQYAEWQQRFKNSVGVAYGLGSYYSSHEDPRAKQHLLRVVELDPKQAKVWQMLSIDAERWGDGAGAREFMHKAMEADPKSPDYAFYWSHSWHGVDDVKWVAASLDVAKSFPTSDRGAQALYWLGEHTVDDVKKIAFWEQARRDFPPAKFRWSASAMELLFDVYLRVDPDKANVLAGAMAQQSDDRDDRETWTALLALARNLVDVKKLVAAGKHADAKKQAAELTVDRFSSNCEMIDLLKAEVLAGSGDVQGAYDALCKRLAAKPEDATRAALLGYGNKLGKNAGVVEADVWAQRDKTARKAPEFALDRYGSDGKLALSSLRGKVVFVTFWFPGCGPCRGEFPNFENVVKKFAGKDLVYLGINGLVEQDGYVESFMRGTKYSFIPLRADDKVCKAEGYNVRGFPENVLIDRDGRIVYEHFRTNANNELLLQRMIESLLDRPASSGGQTPAR